MDKCTLEKFSINEATINCIPGLFGILDIDSNFQLLNSTFLKWAGLKSMDAAINLSYQDMNCKASEGSIKFIQQDNLVRKGDSLRMLAYDCYAGDEWKVIKGFKSARINDKGKIDGLLVYFTDLTNSHILDVSRFLIAHGNKKFYKKPFTYYIVDVYPDLDLTVRQTECLFFIVRGKTAKEIAKILKIEPRTVESYIPVIKAKLCCHNRSQLVELAIEKGYFNYLPESLLELKGMS